MEPHFLLSFDTALGKVRTLRITNINQNVNDEMVSSAMNAIISSQVVNGTSGRVSSARRASMVKTIITPVQLV